MSFEEQNKTPYSAKGNYSIPLAIVAAGIIIAGAIVFSGDNKSSTRNVTEVDTGSPSTEKVRPIAENDHILGNPDAPIKIVEYSDFECPFCKRFHNTMNQVMRQYGNSGEVAWIYRHFPIDQLHPVKARAEAVASECAAEQGGNDAFWQFADKFFDLTPSNNRTEIDTVIPQIVSEIGLDESQFQDCFDSGRYDGRIAGDIQNAVETGGTGTPWSIIIAPNGKTFPLNGSQPFETVNQLINLALQEE